MNIKPILAVVTAAALSTSVLAAFSTSTSKPARPAPAKNTTVTAKDAIDQEKTMTKDEAIDYIIRLHGLSAHLTFGAKNLKMVENSGWSLHMKVAENIIKRAIAEPGFGEPAWVEDINDYRKFFVEYTQIQRMLPNAKDAIDRERLTGLMDLNKSKFRSLMK